MARRLMQWNRFASGVISERLVFRKWPCFKGCGDSIWKPSDLSTVSSQEDSTDRISGGCRSFTKGGLSTQTQSTTANDQTQNLDEWRCYLPALYYVVPVRSPAIASTLQPTASVVLARMDSGLDEMWPTNILTALADPVDPRLGIATTENELTDNSSQLMAPGLLWGMGRTPLRIPHNNWIDGIIGGV